MSNSEIDCAAADWLAKLDAGDFTPEERHEFEAWLAQDVRHRGAFAKVAAAVTSLDPLCAIGAAEVRRLCAATASPPTFWTRRLLAFTGGGAAALAAAGFAGLLLWNGDEKPTRVAGRIRTTPSSMDYTTSVGSTRVIVLPDESIVTLNTDSKISVNYTEHIREIHLARGEALFTVAKNKLRPFIVFAGGTQVRAVGTSFAVRYTNNHPIRVLVQEGVVEVTKPGDTKPVLATAETQTLVPPDAPIKTRTVTYTQITRGIAWQYGQIFFDNSTLGEAAQEYARYSNVRIMVDPAVANRTVTGLFPSNNPAGFAKAAAAVLDLRVELGKEEVHITR